MRVKRIVEGMDFQTDWVKVGLDFNFVHHFLALWLKYKFAMLYYFILLKQCELINSILVCKESISLFHIIFPVPFIFGPICIMEGAETLPCSVFPVPFISISQVFALALRLQPDMCPPASLTVILPISWIFLSYINPIHGTIAFFKIINPFSFEIVAWRVVIHFSEAIFQIIFELSLKNAAAFENNLTITMLLPLLILALIGGLVNCIFPKPMSEAFLYFSLVRTLIRPSVNTSASYSIIFEISFVNYVIGPCECTPSMQ